VCLLPALACDHPPPASLAAEFLQLQPSDPIPLLEGARLGPAALRKVKMGGTTRNAIVVPAPSSFEVWTRVPEQAKLAVGILVLRPKGAGPGEGLHFELEAVTRDGERRTLFASFVSPSAVEGNGIWLHNSLELPGFTAKDVRLVFSVRRPVHARGPASEACCAAWIYPHFEAPAPLPQRPNLVLISLDTLRADHLGCYGYQRPTSPAIDAWAAEGTRFAHAVSQAPWTAPSHMSLFTGLYPTTHQVNSHGAVVRHILDRTRLPALSRETPMLAEVLRAAGYDTGAFTGAGALAGVVGFDRGFEVYHEGIELGRDPANLIRVWLEHHVDRPFFLFLHTYQVHVPYEGSAFVESLPAPRRARVREFLAEEPKTMEAEQAAGRMRQLGLFDRQVTFALYDGGVLRADEAVGRLLADLKAVGLRDRTAIVLVSDHGEEFGERDPARFYNAHGHTLYEELLHVPLIIGFPGRVPAGRVVQRPVRLVDVMPTVLELLRVAAPPRLEGVSLAPLLRGDVQAAPPPALSEATLGPLEQKSIRAGRYKYILEGSTSPQESFRAGPAAREELYDLEADPGERRNLSGEDKARAGALRTELEGLLRDAESRRQGAPGAVDVDKDVQDRLRALGYVH